MNRRRFLRFLGLTPALPLALRFSSDPISIRVSVPPGSLEDDMKRARYLVGEHGPEIRTIPDGLPMRVGTTNRMFVRYVEEILRDDWEAVDAYNATLPPNYLGPPESSLILRQATQPLHRVRLDVTNPAHQLNYVMAVTGLSDVEAAASRHHGLFINERENAWGLVQFRIPHPNGPDWWNSPLRTFTWPPERP